MAKRITDVVHNQLTNTMQINFSQFLSNNASLSQTVMRAINIANGVDLVSHKKKPLANSLFISASFIYLGLSANWNSCCSNPNHHVYWI